MKNGSLAYKALIKDQTISTNLSTFNNKYLIKFRIVWLISKQIHIIFQDEGSVKKDEPIYRILKLCDLVILLFCLSKTE